MSERESIVDHPEAKLDYSPRWENEEDGGSSPTGAPTTVRRHDDGLGSEFHLSSSQSPEAHRKQKLENQAQFESKSEQNAAYALTHIRRAADQLGLSDSVIDRACVVFRKAHEDGVAQGRSLEAAAGAAISVAVREQSTAIVTGEVADVVGERESLIHAAYFATARAADANPAPTTPMSILGRVIGDLDVSHEERRRAEQLLDLAGNGQFKPGSKPAGVAAAAVYLCSDDVLQKDLAEAANVTETTIRKHKAELREHLDDLPGGGHDE